MIEQHLFLESQTAAGARQIWHAVFAFTGKASFGHGDCLSHAEAVIKRASPDASRIKDISGEFCDIFEELMELSLDSEQAAHCRIEFLQCVGTMNHSSGGTSRLEGFGVTLPENIDKIRSSRFASIDAVKKAIGKTWFHIEESNDSICLESRLHGDVGAEEPGIEDVKEARRIQHAIDAAFPHHPPCTRECVDEWTTVTVRKAPRSSKEVLDAENKATANFVYGEIVRAVDRANPTDSRLRKSYNLLPYELGTDGESMKVTLSCPYGRRLLYQDHLGAGFEFGSAEFAEQAGETLLLSVFPRTLDITAVSQGPFEKHTLNQRPPNNVVEVYGKSTITANIKLVDY